MKCSRARLARLVVALLVAAVCASCFDDSVSPHGSADPDIIPLTVVTHLDPHAWEMDPLTLDSAKAIGDILHLGVTFGGGCGEHTFHVVVSSLFMESDPVQASALLSHNDHDDPCDALLHRDLKTGLTQMKEVWQKAYLRSSGTIILQIRLSDTLVVPVQYDF